MSGGRGAGEVWKRVLETILRGAGTAAEVFHWIRAVIVQMLYYTSVVSCGYQLYSVAIGRPANLSQTKAGRFPSC